MSEEIKSGTGPIPPRVIIKNQGQSDVAGTIAPGVAIATPPSVLEKQADGSQPPVSFNKKKTARIALDQVTAEPGATVSVAGAGLASKTIRLAPAMSGQVSATPFPSVGKALTGMLISDDAKRKTSRISLESVLPQLEAASAGGEATPKTIRIKRPSISIPASVSQSQPQVIEPVVVAAPDAKSQTARVDIPPEAVAAEGQQTQKKTIKIRRADGGGTEIKASPRPVSIARNEEEVAVSSSAQVATPHWSFVLIAAAAVVTLCVMMYVLMAQAYPSLGWSVGG
jgi:hypothetical protein